MKKLEYKKFKGLHIVCKGCGKSIEINQSEYKVCNHPIEKQQYKAVIRQNGVRKTKDLKSLEFDEAIKELLDFKHELSNPIKIMKPKKQNKSKNLNINVLDEVKHEKFIDCVMMYSDYLENIDVPFFEQRTRSRAYIRDTIGYILKFRELKQNKLFYLIYHKVYISGILFIYIVDKRLHGFEKRGFYEIIRNRNITNFILNSLV